MNSQTRFTYAVVKPLQIVQIVQVQADDHSPGDEHEIEYDLVAGI